MQPTVNVVGHPFQDSGVKSSDRDLFREHVFNPNLPIFWEILQDYVTALPDKTEDEKKCFVIQKDICTQSITQSFTQHHI